MMEEITLREPRWRRPPVEALSLPAQEVTFGPAPRFCCFFGCKARLSIHNHEQLCFTHQPPRMYGVLPTGPRKAVDRA